MRSASSVSSQFGACARKSSACSRVSGGIPPRQGVQVLLARVSVMLLASRVNPSPALNLANCESDVAISASQAIEGDGDHGRCCARLDQLSRSRVRDLYGAGAVRLNHPRLDLVRSIGVCPASPPTP